jgi:N-methylhydantoinase A/oxoprolinase/acetone carboxylase beta subunit
VVDRARLAPGHAFEGPALVEEYSGTTLVPPGWSAFVTAGGHLLLEEG